MVKEILKKNSDYFNINFQKFFSFNDKIILLTYITADTTNIFRFFGLENFVINFTISNRLFCRLNKKIIKFIRFY